MRRRAADVGDRRRVDTQGVAAEDDGSEATLAARDRRARDPGRQHPTAHRQRSSDDPVATIDHFDDRLRCADLGVERAGRGEERWSRHGQLRDLDGPKSQAVVELTMQVPRDQHVDREPEHDQGEHCCERRGEDGAKPKAHPPSMKPVPRTVEMSGGSPSLRLRFDT